MEYPIGIKEIILAHAERADVIIYFTDLEGKHIILKNNAPAHFPEESRKCGRYSDGI